MGAIVSQAHSHKDAHGHLPSKGIRRTWLSSRRCGSKGISALPASQPAYNIRENKLSNFSSSYIVAEGQFIFVLPFQFGCLRYIAIAIPFSTTRPSPFASVGNPYWMTMSIRLAVRGRLLLWVAAPRRGAELSDNIDTAINILINYLDNVEIHKLVIKDLNLIIKRFNAEQMALEIWASHYVGIN